MEFTDQPWRSLAHTILSGQVVCSRKRKAMPHVEFARSVISRGLALLMGLRKLQLSGDSPRA